jgi:hypothetical protein
MSGFARVKRVIAGGPFSRRNCLRVKAARELDRRVGERDSRSHDFGASGRRVLAAVLTSAMNVALALLIAFTPARSFALEDSNGDSNEYTQLIQEAVERFRTRDFSRARELFKAAHALLPNARTLRGMGLSDFESGHYAVAVAELEAALFEARKPLDAQQRIEVQAVIAHARGFVGTLEIDVTPREAKLTIDGISVRGDSFSLDAGDHVIHASATGYRELEQRVHVVPADLTRVSVSLSPVQAEHPGTQSAQSRNADTDEDTAQTQQTAAYIVGGIGVAGLIVGSIFGVRSILKHNESDRFCGKDDTCIHERGVSAMEEARLAGDISTVAFIAGGLALGAGTVLLLTAPSSGDVERKATAMRLTIGPGSLQIRGAF